MRPLHCSLSLPPQEPRARGEDPFPGGAADPALLRRRDVGQVGRAVLAAGGLEMEPHVVAPLGVEDTERERAERASLEAGEEVLPPEGADGEVALVRRRE